MNAQREHTPSKLSMPALATWLLVFACFTLSSSGYLAWLYHLMALEPAFNVDALTMGAGYACQAAGIALAAAFMRRWPEIMGRVPLAACIAFCFACTAPAALAETLAVTLVAGFLMNLLYGMLSAFYLQRLSLLVNANRRGTVFGVGYASSIIVSWLISMAQGSQANVTAQLVTCAAFSVISLFIAAIAPIEAPDAQGRRAPVRTTGSPASTPYDAALGLPSTDRERWTALALAGVAVLLMSMVKNMGFNFPSADIGSTVNLETSRLFYAAGLVIAGIVVDRSRKRGAVLCMAALIMPFALMAIAGEPVPSAVLWAVDYFFYGFFSVFRVILFADLSARSQRMHLSGFGLMFGRVGDALGTMACVSLGGNTVALVTVAAVMFAACVFVFWRLFQQLFVPAAPQQRSERELFDRFAAHHDLSPREREVLQLILDNKTNAEAAAVLVVSESTVKFHVRNLLRKTGCKNRTELLALYATERP